MRIVLFGDTGGIKQMLSNLPIEFVKCLVASILRPQYYREMEALALQMKIPILIQPRINSPEYPNFVKEFQGMKFDLLLCNSYSMKISTDILRAVNYNALNIHWSLLPDNKGANPTQWAIIKGEEKTGVTIHYMDEGIDTGDVVVQVEEPINENDTWVSVNERLRKLSDDLIKTNFESILIGTNKRQKQLTKLGSTNPRLTPDFPRIDFKRMTDWEIYNLIRAQVEPLPGAFMELDGQRIHFNKYVRMDEVKALRKKYGK